MRRKSKVVKHRPGTQERRELKNKVRRSPEWSELRKLKYDEQNAIDPITLRPLTRGYNCHHMDMNWENYGNLDPSHFVCLNSKGHSTIHYIWDIVKREKSLDVLSRIETIISTMIEINEIQGV